MTLAEIQLLEQRIPLIHAVLNLLTGCNWPLNRWDGNWAAWERWLVKHDEKQLRLVIGWINAQKHWKPEWRKSALTFGRLIKDIGNFDNRLAEAESANRSKWEGKQKPKMDPNRAEILQATGREVPTSKPRTGKEILRQVTLDRFFSDMRKAVDAPPETL